jgi:MATE family multidrug resistance protein
VQVIILMAGLLPNASVALSTMGICLNINAWMYMLPLGLGQAVNTSISNALGAGERLFRPSCIQLGMSRGILVQTGCLDNL